jgi:hypothetical protein
MNHLAGVNTAVLHTIGRKVQIKHTFSLCFQEGTAGYLIMLRTRSKQQDTNKPGKEVTHIYLFF